MYGGGFDAGGFGGGGGFDAGAGGQFGGGVRACPFLPRPGTPPSASPAPLQEQFGGNNFGGATMGSQQAAGGGFQVDNSTPDGQVTLGPALS